MQRFLTTVALLVLFFGSLGAVEVQVNNISAEIWETGEFSYLFAIDFHNDGEELISAVDLEFEYLPDRGSRVRLDPQGFRLNAGGNQVAYVRDDHIRLLDLDVGPQEAWRLLFEANFMGGYGFFNIHINSISFETEEGEEVVVIGQDIRHWLRNPSQSYELWRYIPGGGSSDRNRMSIPFGADLRIQTYCQQVVDNGLEAPIIALRTNTQVWEYEGGGMFVFPDGELTHDSRIRDELGDEYWNFSDSYRMIDHPWVVKSGYASCGILDLESAEEHEAQDGGRLSNPSISRLYYDGDSDFIEGVFSFQENVEAILSSPELERNGFRQPLELSIGTTITIEIRPWVIGDVDGNGEVNQEDSDILLSWMLWEDQNEGWLTSEGSDAIRGKVSYNGPGFPLQIGIQDAYYLQNRNVFGEELGIGVSYADFYEEDRQLNVDARWELNEHELSVETEGNAVQALILDSLGQVIWSQSRHIQGGHLLCWPNGHKTITPLVVPTRDDGMIFRIPQEVGLDGITIEVRAMRLEGLLDAPLQGTVVPATAQLISAYPNPFNSSTRINFVNPLEGEVKLSVFDMNGRRLQLLDVVSGTNSTLWDASAFPAGSYLIQMNAPGTDIQKVTLVK
ncbi:T9SS type A sorting domain-containing protein [Candidatus Gracilibacteria bacterium]|nr:T9SS type A sorting domain-containing protein [Candidatus Gracilibacteria bacterium]